MDRYLADATVFMEMAGYTIIGWQWLKQAVVAAQKLASKDFNANTETFYQSKIHTMEFFFNYELPHAAACEKTLLHTAQLTNIKNHDMFA
jgi:butyryl-CoA dehydrogenase